MGSERYLGVADPPAAFRSTLEVCSRPGNPRVRRVMGMTSMRTLASMEADAAVIFAVGRAQLSVTEAGT